MSWIEAIARNRALVHGAGLTDLAVIVSGSDADRAFWAETVGAVQRDILREDGGARIVSVAENEPLGNFLGTMNAWREIGRQTTPPSTGVSLLSMVFGKGKRLSPFTQALGNRKAAFPTPLKGSRSGAYLRTGDLATLYSNSWLEHLRELKFNGMLIKWGDEATIPGCPWSNDRDFSDVDMVRFVWKTEPTEVLAREKEWFVVDNGTGLIERLVPRQPLASLTESLSEFRDARYSTAVNLGSIAVSYPFLQLAEEVFGDSLGRSVSADWDPHTQFLLLGGDPHAPGLAQAEARFPGLTAKVAELRAAVQQKMGRPVRAGFVDFGDAFWVDFGLHTTLRRTLDALTEETPAGYATRAFFGIPHDRDANGNIIIDSRVAPGAHVSNSVIVDSTIADPASVLNGAVVVGSRHGRLTMPEGGASLFSAVRDLCFAGPRGITLRSVATELALQAGGRHTSIFAGGEPLSLVTNESVVAYNDGEYAQPILGNAVSFEAAGERAGSVDPRDLEANWRRAWERLAI